MGDFNLSLLKSEVSEFSHNFLRSCYLIPNTDKPSRVRGNSASLIDNIFVNNPDCVSVSGNIISDVSDHAFLAVLYTHIRRREQCATSQISIGILLRSILIKLIDIDYIFSSFYGQYTKIINKHVPIKQIFRSQLKRFSKPWITQGIRSSIETKNKLFASGDQTKYKFYRNEINHLISISKRGYFHNHFEKNFTNMKTTWEALNNLLNRRTRESRQVNAIKDFNNGNKINRYPQRIDHSRNTITDHNALCLSPQNFA